MLNRSRSTSPTPAEVEKLAGDAEFIAGVLEASSDCIKIISLDGKLEFMSAGGQRVMEVDDVNAVIGCPWPDFWPGEGGALARKAVEEARAGKTFRFEGEAPTAKGNGRYWEVTVSPIRGADGKPNKILSVSRDISERMEKARVQELLLREMQHRVMNTLAMVSAIAAQSIRTAPDLATAGRSISVRIDALRKAHGLLLGTGTERTTVKDIVRGTTKPFDEKMSRFSVEGPDIEISARAALAIALLMNELSTNATKYGALSNAAGKVDIGWTADDARGVLVLTWKENGGPAVSQPERTSFGMRLIEQAVRGQLDGHSELRFEPNGVSCTAEIPLAQLKAD